jgi:hypothetical protein
MGRGSARKIRSVFFTFHSSTGNLTNLTRSTPLLKQGTIVYLANLIFQLPLTPQALRQHGNCADHANFRASKPSQSQLHLAAKALRLSQVCSTPLATHDDGAHQSRICETSSQNDALLVQPQILPSSTRDCTRRRTKPIAMPCTSPQLSFTAKGLWFNCSHTCAVNSLEGFEQRSESMQCE